MRVLVTGGAGFIGSHIVHLLRQRGVEVAVLDNLSTGKRANVPAGVPFFEIDLRDRQQTAAVFRELRPTHLCHQAAQASVKLSVDDPLADAATNVLGGLHALEGARAAGVERVVFASSGGAIYGEVAEGTRAREGWPLRPKSPYAAAKASLEHYLEVYSQSYGLGYTVLRYANVFGPRQDPFGEAGVVAIFAERLRQRLPVKLFARRVAGDAGCVRDYVFVEDVVAANWMALGGGLASGVYNVGSGQRRTTREVLEAIARQLVVAPDFEPAPPRAGDLEESVLDPGKLEGQGWSAAVGFDAGIARTVEWFNSGRPAAPE